MKSFKKALYYKFYGLSTNIQQKDLEDATYQSLKTKQGQVIFKLTKKNN